MEEQNTAQTPVVPVEPPIPASPPVQPEITTPTPPYEPKKSLPKWLFTLMILVLIVVGGASAYFLGKNSANKTQTPTTQTASLPTATPIPTPETITSPTPTSDETANWKTYTNKSYNLSLKYPSAWSFYENNSSVVFGPIATENHIGEKVPPYVSSYITLDLYASDLNSDLIAFKKISEEFKPVWKDFKINQIDGKEVRHLGCLSGNCRDIIFQHDKTIFDFFDQNNLKELDGMLSTFKFTQ